MAKHKNIKDLKHSFLYQKQLILCKYVSNKIFAEQRKNILTSDHLKKNCHIKLKIETLICDCYLLQNIYDSS